MYILLCSYAYCVHLHRWRGQMKGRVRNMDGGKKKIWICLILVVLTAVVLGSGYYLWNSGEKSSEGFLIRDTGGRSGVCAVYLTDEFTGGPGNVF